MSLGLKCEPSSTASELDVSPNCRSSACYITGENRCFSIWNSLSGPTKSTFSARAIYSAAFACRWALLFDSGTCLIHVRRREEVDIAGRHRNVAPKSERVAERQTLCPGHWTFSETEVRISALWLIRPNNDHCYAVNLQSNRYGAPMSQLSHQVLSQNTSLCKNSSQKCLNLAPKSKMPLDNKICS